MLPYLVVGALLTAFAAAAVYTFMRDAARRDRDNAFWVPEKHTVFFATYVEVNLYTPRGLLLDSRVVDVFPHDDPTTDHHWLVACAAARAKARNWNRARTRRSDDTRPLRRPTP